MKEKLKNTAKVWTDPDDAPELDQAFFDKATPYVDGQSVSLEVFKQAVIKRGRPPAEVTKRPVKLRLDPDILDAFFQIEDAFRAIADTFRDAENH